MPPLSSLDDNVVVYRLLHVFRPPESLESWRMKNHLDITASVQHYGTSHIERSLGKYGETSGTKKQKKKDSSFKVRTSFVGPYLKVTDASSASDSSEHMLAVQSVSITRPNLPHLYPIAFVGDNSLGRILAIDSSSSCQMSGFVYSA